MRATCVLWVAVACLALASTPPHPIPTSSPYGPPPVYSGWAVEAYPELTSADMEALVRRQVEAGANVVWIGHNNPGEVDPDKVEPGLSYAVFEAYRNPDDPRHGQAVAYVRAQHRLLCACRTVGVKAVLPIGYQIQMGEVWNSEHPDDLRLDAEGRALDIYGGGISASFYASSYRQAIEAYYEWIDAEFVRAYGDVILMLNLADEPVGGDYSTHAEAEFRRQHGFGFDKVGDDEERQRALGEFQSHYVVEYAAYSALLWMDIHPDMPVTMSFDGGQARATLTMPDVESLFRDTPPNLVITFDAYPHDGLPHIAVSDKELVELALLVQSLGLFSARYGRPLWLWAAANSWGLSQGSADQGSISDALVNGLSLALWVRRSGGTIEGIVYWNLNVKGQGLYNDTHETAYDPDEMFAQVSALLPRLRRLMLEPAGVPRVLVLSPPAVAQRRIGAARESVRLEVQPYHRLEVLARQGVAAAVVSQLDGWSMEDVRSIVVLAPSARDLTPGDLAILRRYLRQGGRAVTSPAVARALESAAGGQAKMTSGGLVVWRGNLAIAQKGIAVLFEDDRQEILSGFWDAMLGLDGLQPGYQAASASTALWYNAGSEPIRLEDWVHRNGYGYRYDEQGQPVQPLDSFSQGVTLKRREFILLETLGSFHAGQK